MMLALFAHWYALAIPIGLVLAMVWVEWERQKPGR